MRNKIAAERLAAYTERAGKCLVWTGALNNKDRTKGYGTMRIRGKLRFVHQLAYELAYGSIPINKVVRHTCDNRLCCEPTHLILGTHKDNTQDMVARGRSAKGGTHGRSKLTEKDVINIKKQLATRTHLSLAQEYNVAESTISAISRGITWKHVG